MGKIKEDDLDLLEFVRGRFSDEKSSNRVLVCVAGLFGIVLPLVFAYFLFIYEGMPEWPLNGDQWCVLLLIPAGIWVGWFLYKLPPVNYEFTGSSIIRWRGDTKKGEEVKFKDVKERSIETHPIHQYTTLTLKGEGTCFSMVVYPSVKAAILQIKSKRERAGQAGVTKLKRPPT